MRTKASLFSAFTAHYDYDIFVIIETWLNQDFFNEEFFNNNLYNVYRKDRDLISSGLSRGGGVMIAVKCNILSKQMVLNDSNKLLDQLCVKIQSCKGNLYLFASYIPPNSLDALYCSHIQNILNLSENLRYDDRLCVVGDFNLNNIVWSEIPNSDKFLPSNINKSFEINLIDSFLSIGVHQVNRIFNKLGRLLDLVFVSSDLKFQISECHSPLSPANMHHSAIYIEIEFYQFKSTELDSSLVQYDYKSCNLDRLKSTLYNVDWHECMQSEVVAICYEEFLKRIGVIVEENVPRVRPWVYKLPWYTKGLKKLKNLRNKFFNKFKISNCSSDENLYLHYMREFNFLNKFLYNQYILSYNDSLKLNPKRFFTFIRSKRNSSSIPASVTYNNVVSNSVLDTVNLFKDFFQSSFATNATPINIHDFDHITSCVDIGALTVFDDDIISGISKLGNSYKSDVDGISAFLLKECASIFVLPLRLLFSKSLSSGYFIQKWKFASVLPVFKTGDKTNVSNYRPISKLPNIAKILEHIVYEKIFFHLKRYLSLDQHGFIAGRSTCTNLAIFTNFCIRNFENGIQIDTIYTDFSKAFDKVNHDILLIKLHKYGFHSSILNWFRSYLSFRQCSVCIDNSYSDVYIPTSGIPQGSILGPLLFNIFINDIGLCFLNSKHLLYADDLKMFKAINTVNDVLLLQDDINRVTVWSKVNALFFNTNKCFHMTFHRCRDVINSSYHIMNCELAKIYEYFDLGVVFDVKLTFIGHINYLVPKAYSLLYFIRRNVSDFSDPYTMKILFTSFVRSKLEYASVIWSPIASKHIGRIEKVQKSFLKFALRSLNFTDPIPSYESRCMLISLKTLESRRVIASIMFLHGITSGSIDCPELLSFIRFNVPCRRLRHFDTFNIEMHSTNYASNEPIVRAMKHFNSICNNIDLSFQTTNFKNSLYNFII